MTRAKTKNKNILPVHMRMMHNMGHKSSLPNSVCEHDDELSLSLSDTFPISSPPPVKMVKAASSGLRSIRQIRDP